MTIDLTHTIKPGIPVYPGDPVPDLKTIGSLTRNGCRETQVTVTTHTGTHMDAPSHILRDGSSLDQLPISQFSGRATVLDVSKLGPVITSEFLQEHHQDIYCADFVLFYTGWENRWNTEDYLEDTFPVPDEAAARYLVSCGLKGVGTDAMSIDRLRYPDNPENAFPVHTILAKDGVIILESLCLKKVRGRKDIRFMALPLKFENSDGAPVRAIAGLGESFGENFVESAKENRQREGQRT